MKRLIPVVVLVLTASAAGAQLHQDVFPGESGDALLQHLESAYKPATVLSYADARRKMFGEIDNVNDSIHGVYSDDVIYINPQADPKDDAFSKGFNTEHTYPQSKGATGNAKSDLHHLFPTRIDVNGARGHLPFAEIPDPNTDEWFYKSTVLYSIPASNIDAYSELDENVAFEPREAQKGNVARAMMYFYTMYHAQADAADPDYFDQMIPTLCAWHIEDAVDQREWDRTWAIANYEDGKPNPFVLDCTLALRTYCADQNYTCNPNGTQSAGDIRLYGAFPNPAAGRFKIRFALAHYSARVAVHLTDIYGREVRHVSVPGMAGPHEVWFDLPPGIYFYIVRSGRALRTGRVQVF